MLHPAVRTHPQTGKRIMWVNRSYTHRMVHLDGTAIDPDSACGDGGENLLKELCSLPYVPEYQLRLNWQSPGDFTMYDNRAVQHYGVSDYGRLPRQEQGRLLEHIAALGALPFFKADDGSVIHSRFISDDYCKGIRDPWKIL